MIKRISSVILRSWSGYVIPDTNMRIELLKRENQDHVDGAVEVLSHVFSTSLTEPTLAQFGIPKIGPGSISEYLYTHFDLRLDESLSVVVIDGDQDDKVVAAIYSEDFGYFLENGKSAIPEPVQDFVDQWEKWQVVMDIFGILEDYYKDYCNRAGRTKVVHLFWGCCDSSVRGNSIALHMIEQTGELARERGYEALFGECTNYFSHQCFGDERALLKVYYDNYVYKDGSKPFLSKNKQI